MKMLAVSDVESGRYYTWYRDGILKEFDLIVSCGDLKREYLEFLVTMEVLFGLVLCVSPS